MAFGMQAEWGGGGVLPWHRGGSASQMKGPFTVLASGFRVYGLLGCTVY